MMLKDRVAIVTGGGSGIGRAICLRLAAEGARVAVAELNPGSGAETAQLIAGRGAGEGVAIGTDITDLASVQSMVDAVCERWGGRIDVLVNNAGWDRLEPFLESQPETWEKVIAVNLRGPINCFSAVLPVMVRQGGGRVISISSDAGRVGSTGEAVYSACKAGIIGFSKTVAREVARHMINVNVVCPGPTKTPMLDEVTSGSQGERIIEAMVRSVPWRRLGEPEEIAAAVAFFASDDAAFCTGQVLSVSGGLTMAG
jgi:2-hydroxycyclohexanecarboxyl-CoA dehydrogenase